MASDRVERALGDYEEAVFLLVLIAREAPPTFPRPPRWRPLARYRHLVDHDETLAMWAETVEQFAEEADAAAAALNAARRRADLDESLGHG